MDFIAKHKLLLMGALVGAIGGYLYYDLVGCTSGTCPITSRPLPSTLYGAAMGGMLLSWFRKDS